MKLDTGFSGRSAGSKLIPRAKGPMPSIERTEIEKIRLAQRFLEARGFFVLPKLMSRDEVIEYLGCSNGHLSNLRLNADFPTPFDINAAKKSIEHTREKPRWLTSDVVAWLEGRKA